ncbi:phosphate acyltransferase PlsX [Lactobacillus sp. ESL0791]|uniref:phosphate acyltransferase PlsX n=1 Tax=Lactobacillus sp. ESL0791 TaxID=2983234 RepID=UPI0023F77262|nr:phosphate acyltransferase PlsX [Lactobacillus sp. ESL0791]MDF7638744.1 phosphate acyltransferase PlsX [Lactobacillus sp. ESL0791]
MKTIAIDTMGGENAPEAIVAAVLKAKDELKKTKFILFGDEAQIKKLLPKEELDDRIQVVATTQLIMDDDEPVKAIRAKKDSSMVAAAQFVKEGKADAILSLGNTGALLACGIFIIGRIKGIARPGLMPTLPVKNSDDGFNMIDVGANAKTKPEYLLQWAEMAAYYAEKVRGIANPRVMLLNNGSEYDKGDDTHQAAYNLLKESGLNFTGNIEGNELLLGKADVVVTDGFTGNAILKNIEGTSSVLLHLLKDSLLNSGLKAKVGALLIKDALKGIISKFDTAKYGGAVLLGVNAPVVKTHGRSDERAIYFTLKQIDKILQEKIIDQFKLQFAKIK